MFYFNNNINAFTATYTANTMRCSKLPKELQSSMQTNRETKRYRKQGRKHGKSKMEMHSKMQWNRHTKIAEQLLITVKNNFVVNTRKYK